jgi:hypothetical protein
MLSNPLPTYYYGPAFGEIAFTFSNCNLLGLSFLSLFILEYM